MFVYKVTNKLNQNYYIGQHRTNNINDGYLGSGSIIIKAIKKYGKENFERQILCFCDSQQELNLREKEFVNKDVINDEKSYNIRLGGNQPPYQFVSGEKNPMYGKHHTKETIEYLRQHCSNYGEKNGFYGKHHSEQTKKFLKEMHIKYPEELLLKIKECKQNGMSWKQACNVNGLYFKDKESYWKMSVVFKRRNIPIKLRELKYNDQFILHIVQLRKNGLLWKQIKSMYPDVCFDHIRHKQLFLEEINK